MILRSLLLAGTALLVVSCAVGPDFEKPTAPPEAGYTPEKPAATASTDVAGGAAQRFVDGKDIPGQWWTLFHSEPLNQLIEEALKANPTLDAAQATLRQAQETVAAQKGVFFPQVNGNLSTTREKISGAAFGNPNQNSIFTLTTGSGDRFLRHRCFRRQAPTARIDRGAGGISALPARSRLSDDQLECRGGGDPGSIAARADRRDAGDHRRRSNSSSTCCKSNSISARRPALGGAGAAGDAQRDASDVARPAETARAAAQSVDRARRPLSEPGGEPDLRSRQPAICPQDLPLSLPSKLVAAAPGYPGGAGAASFGQRAGRRRDREYAAAIHAQRQSAATAVLDIASLFTAAGHLEPRRRTDDPDLPRRRSCFIRSARPKRPSMPRRRNTAARSSPRSRTSPIRCARCNPMPMRSPPRSRRRRSAARQSRITRSQYQLGAINYTTLLNAETTYQQAHVNRVTAQATRYADTAALFQALGGGWWNRSDVAIERMPTAAPKQNYEDISMTGRTVKRMIIMLAIVGVVLGGDLRLRVALLPGIKKQMLAQLRESAADGLDHGRGGAGLAAAAQGDRHPARGARRRSLAAGRRHRRRDPFRYRAPT